MNILLFNDNPVVRKLVALSAQKTKDDLNVVWSVDEIEESSYDLVIVDDALYSDEMFNSLKEVVRFKTALLMATRGNAVPAGFEHVINKPFLPTDLVDLFAKIDADLAAKGGEKTIDLNQQSSSSTQKEMSPAINLEEPLFDNMLEEEDFLPAGLDDLSEPFSMNEDEPFPAILDHEEVQEVRGLLEDTEIDHEDMSSQEGDDFELDESNISLTDKSAEEEEEFDFEGFDLDEEIAANKIAQTDFTLPDTEELNDQSIDEAAETEAEKVSDDELLLDDMLLENEDVLASQDEPLSDEAFGELELKIQEAVGDLEDEDLNTELEGDESFDFEGLDLEDESDKPVVEETSEMNFDETLDEMNFDDDLLLDENELLDEDTLSEEEETGSVDEGMDDDLLESLKADTEAMGAFTEETDEEFDELDMLDERELKRAIGEEIEEEPEIQLSEDTEYDAILDNNEDELIEKVSSVSSALTGTAGGIEGAEALQTLLKALTNEDVVKALKGLNISININFGNDK